MGFAFQYEIVPAKCNSEENGDKSSKNGSSIEGEEGTFINDVKHVFFSIVHSQYYQYILFACPSAREDKSCPLKNITSSDPKKSRISIFNCFRVSNLGNRVFLPLFYL
jgi:hypothetical protein